VETADFCGGVTWDGRQCFTKETATCYGSDDGCGVATTETFAAAGGVLGAHLQDLLANSPGQCLVARDIAVTGTAGPFAVAFAAGSACVYLHNVTAPDLTLNVEVPDSLAVVAEDSAFYSVQPDVVDFMMVAERSTMSSFVSALVTGSTCLHTTDVHILSSARSSTSGGDLCVLITRPVEETFVEPLSGVSNTYVCVSGAGDEFLYNTNDVVPTGREFLLFSTSNTSPQARLSSGNLTPRARSCVVDSVAIPLVLAGTTAMCDDCCAGSGCAAMQGTAPDFPSYSSSCLERFLAQ